MLRVSRSEGIAFPELDIAATAYPKPAHEMQRRRLQRQDGNDEADLAPCRRQDGRLFLRHSLQPLNHFVVLPVGHPTCRKSSKADIGEPRINVAKRQKRVRAMLQAAFVNTI